MTVNGWPLILRHADIGRLLARNTSQIVLTSKVKLGEYQVQDALIVRRNERYRKTGHFELQQDPTVRTIAITTIDRLRLIDVDLQVVRAAGFKTQRDFYDDWLERRGHIDPSLEVLVCRFQTAEPIRLLHRRPHRGYTSNPRLAAIGEPEALSAADLERYADTARWRDEKREADEREDRRLAARLGDLERRARTGDQEAARHLFMIRKHLEHAEMKRSRKAS